MFELVVLDDETGADVELVDTGSFNSLHEYMIEKMEQDEDDGYWNTYRIQPVA